MSDARQLDIEGDRQPAPLATAKPSERRSARVNLPALPDPSALFSAPAPGTLVSDATAQRIGEEEAARDAAMAERDRLQESLGQVIVNGTNEDADRHEASIRDQERNIERSSRRLIALRADLDAQRETERLANVAEEAAAIEAGMQAVMALLTGPYAALVPWLVELGALVSAANAAAARASARCAAAGTSQRVESIDMRRSRPPTIKRTVTAYRTVWRDQDAGGLVVRYEDMGVNDREGRYVREDQPLEWSEGTYGNPAARFAETLRLPVPLETTNGQRVAWPPAGTPGYVP